MLVLLAAHLLTGVVIMVLGDRLGRLAFALAGLAPLATLVWAIARAGGILDGRPVTERVTWVGALDLRLDVRVDGFSLLMVLLVSGIGVLICLYSLGYFSHPPEAIARLAALLTMFAGAMTALVCADHIVMVYVAWEATSVISYLLIGNSDRDGRARAAALQALLITGAGGLALLFGLIVLGGAAGSYRLSDIVAAGLAGGIDGPALTAGIVCVLAGAFTKSAQHPFASWLPGAMVAPTPVSAYLHSATMVKAGVYLVARLAPAFAGEAPWRVLCVVVGLTTMVIGSLRALRQHDLKLLLAMGTVSQLGFLVATFGLGLTDVTLAAVVLLTAHAVFKSSLFMVVGIVDHELGTRDVRRIPVLGRGWRVLQATAVVGAASMAGVPLAFGFIAKEELLDSLVGGRAEVAGGTAVVAVVVLASALTFAYSARFVLGVLGRLQGDGPALAPAAAAHAPPLSFVAPAALLAVGTVVLGVLPSRFDPLLDAAASSLDPRAEAAHLAVWHGVNVALGLSALVIALGVALVLARHHVARVQRIGRWPSADRGYLASLRAVTGTADRVTAVVQSGSLPVYAGVILVTVAVAPSVALLAGDGLPDVPDGVDLPIHLPIVGLLIVGALGTAIVTRRFAAALLLGGVGYAMAALYVAQGAPDLALTQFAIETLSVVLFMLVLRFLPDQPARRVPRSSRIIRLVISAVVGAFVLLFALTMSGQRLRPSVSEEHVARAVPEGKGNNVVNVTIVDFRGLDTLGEIAVLVVAALGAVGLARIERRPDAAAGEPEVPPSPAVLEPERAGVR